MSTGSGEDPSNMHDNFELLRLSDWDNGGAVETDMVRGIGPKRMFNVRM